MYSNVSSSGVGAWVASSSYPIDDLDPSCAVESGYMYCIGGWESVGAGGITAGVYYSPLSSSGSGVWKVASSYPVGIEGPNCSAYSGYVYCVGGLNSTDRYTNVVYYAQVSSSGVGTWTRTTPYPLSVEYLSCVSNVGFIYCVGDGTNMVYYAPLSSSGVGAWTSTNNYPLPINFQSCVMSSAYIYCMGGENINNTDTSAVYYGALSSSGVISWSQGTSYPIAIDLQEGCSSYNGTMYCVGGSGTNAVYFASISPPPTTNSSTTTMMSSSTATSSSSTTSSIGSPTTYSSTTSTTSSTPPTTTITSSSTISPPTTTSSTSSLSSSNDTNKVNASVSTSSSSSVTPSQVSTQTIEIAAIAIVTLVFGSTTFFVMRRRHAN